MNSTTEFCFIYKLSVSSHRGKAWADEGSSLGPDRHARDIESLDRYAMERWEVILHFMVGSPSAAVSQDLAQLLVQAGLMKRYVTVVVQSTDAVSYSSKTRTKFKGSVTSTACILILVFSEIQCGIRCQTI